MIDFRTEEIQGSEDAAVGTEVELLHDFFVIYAVADVDVGCEGNMVDGGVEI